MDKNEVMESALDSGFDVRGFRNNEFKLTRFAAEIEKRTIERCAMVCESYNWSAETCAVAIRALGEK